MIPVPCVVDCENEKSKCCVDFDAQPGVVTFACKGKIDTEKAAETEFEVNVFWIQLCTTTDVHPWVKQILGQLHFQMFILRERFVEHEYIQHPECVVFPEFDHTRPPALSCNTSVSMIRRSSDVTRRKFFAPPASDHL